MPGVTIPDHGVSPNEILDSLKSMKSGDADWRSGKVFSLVYHLDDTHSAFIKEAYGTFFSENGLSPIAFPSLKKLENEAIAMTAAMLGGGEGAVGTMTSGGSESLLMAVKTARDWARAEKPQIKNPEMILPISAHPGLWKGAHYFDVKPVFVPMTDEFKADLQAVEATINENTIMIVGSAPAYPQGVIDPIPELAAIAKRNGLWMHVDSCLGGFMLPWLKKLGYPIPPFDLSVDGVSSISADVHKYGFAAKGASTIIFRDEELRRHQFFACAGWPGGLYASPSMTGTRPGGAIAAAWAALKYFGADGYMKMAGSLMKTTKAYMDGVASIPGLRILGKPDMTVFAFTSDDSDIYMLGEAMEQKGWHIDLQQLPPCMHMMVMPTHAQAVSAYLKDLREAANEVRGSTSIESTGTAAIYGMVGTMVDRKEAEPLLVEFMNQTFKLGS